MTISSSIFWTADKNGMLSHIILAEIIIWIIY